MRIDSPTDAWLGDSSSASTDSSSESRTDSDTATHVPPATKRLGRRARSYVSVCDGVYATPGPESCSVSESLLLDEYADGWGVTSTAGGLSPVGPAGTDVGAQSRVQLHPQELDRLDSLVSYAVLDTPPSSSYDALTDLAARLCETPMAAVVLVDLHRLWFKSVHGLTAVQTSRAWGFSTDVVFGGTNLAISDATTSQQYATKPCVLGAPHVKAYLGVPLVGRDGLPLGALCVMDQRSRVFTASQEHLLTQLADQVVALLEQDRRDHTDGLLKSCVVAEARDPRRLRRALDEGEFVPYYQPVVDMRTGRPHQLEALLRWVHPEQGVLPPASFLPGIEANALVIPVGRGVLDAALATLASLRAQQVELPGGLTVNVASRQLARPGLARDVLAALERHQLPGDQLTLEITEATEVPDVGVAWRELTALREIGVHVSIDDFGVGWSNLTRVLQLPADGLKIDRSFAGAVLVDPAAAAVVASTVSLAGTLNLSVTAEGIEQTDVRDHFLGLGCHLGQGWLYSPAVSKEALPGAIAELISAGAA